ncbi:MAG: tRNA (adenosine(37)-N6)-threonylcarbamoyltransferase complex ATPase subunit type 1 TsaE [Planctomycetaceae bacterium]|nr:tRNA (adenosine(37)-N6)-threonylcarbamoyltransferase complex ATPase subunit type 1 TsaE [Planctomycetaceae bacterium]MBP62318.1 tRNA (adenosine(37)-N6)-threonylcarbamoyltransferase complex ATPase subunit type 1 TsaE [Planctomycetaceae bacterium]
MDTFTFHAADHAATDRFAAALVTAIPDGTTVALEATLGAGKTYLVQSVAENAGIPREQVTSPTFVLCQEYHGNRTIHHFDAYRINDEDEFLQLGMEEYFQAPGLIFIEWSERVSNCLPSSHLRIRIDVTGETSRNLVVSAIGQFPKKILSDIENRLAGLTGEGSQ